ncbi:MAG: hypothetical protein ACI8X5_002566 [Planctomycetota bacterium]|jgi:hypothetical protein
MKRLRLARLSILTCSLLATSSVSLAQVLNETGSLLPQAVVPNSQLGSSVATDGNYYVVGAPERSIDASQDGAAFFFDALSGQVIRRIDASDGTNQDFFGMAAATSGGLALIGAPFDNTNGNLSGSAYIFSVPAGQELHKLVPSDGAAFDEFGRQLAIGGGLAVVGNPLHDSIVPASSGAVYIFDSSTGQELAKLSGGTFSSEGFGSGVAIGDGKIFVGVTGDDDQGLQSGAVYVFDASTFQLQSKLHAADAAPGDWFGTQVDVDGDNLLVTASGADPGRAVYLIDIPSGQTLQKLTAGTSLGDGFGSSISLAGAFALIGTPNSDEEGPDSGSAYLFEVSTGLELAKLLYSAGTSGDLFGKDVALNDRNALVGMPFADVTWFRDGAALSFDLAAVSESGNAFCFGDGNGSPCPCSSNGNAGQGCANSGGQGGAVLAATGHASIAVDTIGFEISNVPGDKPGLLLRGANQINRGMGNLVGDGLLCTSGQTARSHVQTTSSGSTVFTNFKGQSFGQASYGAGVTANYQFWYRDTENTCSGSGFNFTNAWAVEWGL